MGPSIPQDPDPDNIAISPAYRLSRAARYTVAGSSAHEAVSSRGPRSGQRDGQLSRTRWRLGPWDGIPDLQSSTSTAAQIRRAQNRRRSPSRGAPSWNAPRLTPSWPAGTGTTRDACGHETTESPSEPVARQVAPGEPRASGDSPDHSSSRSSADRCSSEAIRRSLFEPMYRT